MKLLLHFVAILFYISTIYADSEKTVLSVFSDFPKVSVEPEERPINNDDTQREFPEHPKDKLVKLDQGRVKVATAKDSYKDVLLSLKKLAETDQRLKLQKRMKFFFQKPPKNTINELKRSRESDEINPNAQDTLQQLNNNLDQLTNQNGQYLKKTPHGFSPSPPNNNIVFSVKPQYRYTFEPQLSNKIKNKKMRSNDQDVKDAQYKAKIIRRVKEHEEKLDNLELPSRIVEVDTGRERFKMDSVLNLIGKFRRRRGSSDEETSRSSSSDREIHEWKEEFREMQMKKKYAALNETRPTGDVINMVAARPLGVPCGDPHQHDLPWGFCTMAAECEPEYRIFRGDLLCGRTEYVCCVILTNDQDMYQAFDVSFDDKSLSPDTREKRMKDKSSRENNKKKNYRGRKKRRRERQKRKRKIKKRIKNIVTEIRKILDKEYKNGTKQRKRKTKMLKKFIIKMKKQYKKDKRVIKDIHEETMIIVDANLMKKLNQIMNMNENFVKNETFREIVVNGRLTKKSARMLVEAYPDMQQYIPKILRRFGFDDNFGDYYDYDVEYGYLYY